jgi:L-lactate dehydrogenase complex protein LldG
VSSAREEILASVRAAVGDRAPGPVSRRYRTTGARSHEQRISLFCERVGDYRAEVIRVSTREIAPAVLDTCRARHARRLIIPSGLPPEWRPDAIQLTEDTGLTPAELDGVDGVITGCTIAIAETGTIALAGGAQEGRRAISLVPDLHLCVVREAQIVELVPEAITLLGDLVARQRRPITLISGPSATSDIELTRVEGVHGPRTLIVLVVGAG